MHISWSNIFHLLLQFFRTLPEHIRSFRYDRLVLFLLVQAVLLLALFVILGVIPVHREVSHIKQYVSGVPSKVHDRPTPGVAELAENIRSSEHHEAFLRSAIELSRSDSMSLLVDLSDRLAVLSFKGVSLLECSISSFDLNQGFGMLPVFLRDSLFSGPMQVEEELASIEKYPVVVKKAPRDTIEAATAAAPELPVQNDVFVLFVFQNNMVLELRQQEQELAGMKRAYRNYSSARDRWLRRWHLQNLKESGGRGYLYHLIVELDREDIRSLYRALPMKPFVVIRYGMDGVSE